MNFKNVLYLNMSRINPKEIKNGLLALQINFCAEFSIFDPKIISGLDCPLST